MIAWMSFLALAFAVSKIEQRQIERLRSGRNWWKLPEERPDPLIMKLLGADEE